MKKIIKLFKYHYGGILNVILLLLLSIVVISGVVYLYNLIADFLVMENSFPIFFEVVGLTRNTVGIILGVSMFPSILFLLSLPIKYKKKIRR
jgi:hypothetical protein